MTCTKFSTHHRPAKPTWILSVAAFLLAACEMDAPNPSSGGGGDPIGGGAPTITAAAVANTEMTATITRDANGTTEVLASDSRAQGSDLSGETLSASSGLGDSVSASFSLTTTGGTVVFVIQDDAVSNGQGRIAGIGKNQTPNNHQVMITLASTEPVTGALTVTLEGSSSSLAGSGFTSVDIGNDGAPDWQTPNLEDSYSETVTVDGTFEIRTETVTQVQEINSISRSVTLTFVPTGGGGADGAANAPLPVALDCTVANGSDVTRVETLRASIPFPRSSYQPADLQSMSIDGHETAWMPMQTWPDGSVKIAQAQFTDVLQSGESKQYTVSREQPALRGSFVRNRWVDARADSFEIGAEVRDTFHVPYRSFAIGSGEVLQTSPLVETRRYRTYHESLSGGGIGRDYLSSTYYVTEFRDMPFILVDWVLGNDYLGADDAGGSSDPNLYALGDADVRGAYFLVKGGAECIPYRADREHIEQAGTMTGGFDGYRVMHDTYLGDAQSRRYRFLVRFDPSDRDQLGQSPWQETANAMIDRPMYAIATQRTWQETAAAGLVGGPIDGPVDAVDRAIAEYDDWSAAGWFGTWGSHGDAVATGSTGADRNHPLSPELAHAIQGSNPRLLEKLEQMAWAQAMRPYHLYGLKVGDEQRICLWDGTPLLAAPGEHLGRKDLRDHDPYVAYRSLSQGDPDAHGWDAFDPEHWSTDLLFDYWTVSGDAWAQEELRQLGQSLKSLMRLQDFPTQSIQSAQAEGWCMQGFAQVYQATRDPGIKDYALRRVNEIVEVERRKDHPSRALTFLANDPATQYPMSHEVFMPWQHGAVLYGYLGAYLAFDESLLLQIAEDVASTVEYAWVSNINHPNMGWIENGLRYYVPVSHNGTPIPANHWDHLSSGASLGSSPLGGAHESLVGGLHLLADSTSEPEVRAKALHYGGMLQSAAAQGARWNKWFYCTPSSYIYR